MLSLMVNGRQHEIDVPSDMPLLWVLRDVLGLTGTKFGCGIARCGACLVHIDGEARASCITPVGSIAGASVTTIEGLSSDASHPVQRAWIEHQVPQCGYCQPGFIMATAALFAAHPHPTQGEIERALEPHLCRCGTYGRMKAAIAGLAERA